jgi:hypothetical protein
MIGSARDHSCADDPLPITKMELKPENATVLNTIKFDAPVPAVSERLLKATDVTINAW